MMESRLDSMLSRIAMETEEIRELEQQLSDGQIQVNELLQKDLQGIISGLQEYLRCLREQLRQAESRVHLLEEEKEALQRQLQATQRQRKGDHARAAVFPQDIQSRVEQLADLISRSDVFCLQDWLVSILELVYRAGHTRSSPDQKLESPEHQECLEEEVHRLGQHLRSFQKQAQKCAQNQIEAELQSLRAELEHQGAVLEDVREERDALLAQLQAEHLLVATDVLQLRELHQALNQPHLHRQYHISSEEGSRGTTDNTTDDCGGRCTRCNIPEHRNMMKMLAEERMKFKMQIKQLQAPHSCVCVCGEVACVEQTLLKRRSELREADRRLLSAQSCLQRTTEKVLEMEDSATWLPRDLPERVRKTRKKRKELVQ